MPVLVGNMATFAVAAIYLIWRAYLEVRLRREKVLRRRIAYMLWVAAEQVGPERERHDRRNGVCAASPRS